MSTITFDALKFANTLKEAGVPDRQAEAEARAMADAFVSNAEDLVAKGDLLAVRTEFKANINGLENKISLLDAKVDAKFVKLSWMLAALLALAAANFAKQYF